jgi:MFS family permease
MQTGWSSFIPSWATAIYEVRDPVTVTFYVAVAQAPAIQNHRNGDTMRVARHGGIFFGWRVVGAASVLAVLGWGTGFYGPPIYLQTIQQNRGWPVGLISTAVTTHFVVGAVVVANLPTLHARFGIPNVTKAGALFLAIGVFGWASATAPWQLFTATLFSGAGWAAMGGAAVNAIVAPWFVRTRPAALSMAYNGASIGGVVFSPLWAAGIALLGFPIAAAAIGIVMALTMWVLADWLLSRTPQQMGLRPDNDVPRVPLVSATAPVARPRLGSSLWHDPKFLTLTIGTALGLFAQIGLITHLFSLLAAALGPQPAALAMGLATASAIAGRTIAGWVIYPQSDRRVAACASYTVQIVGSIAFIAAAGTSAPLLLLGGVLFGAGIGNATSLLPLIAQAEFPEDRVQRVVALIVAVSQAAYAFAPAIFGLVREFALCAADAAPPEAPGSSLRRRLSKDWRSAPFGWAEALARLAASSSVQPPKPLRPPP